MRTRTFMLVAGLLAALFLLAGAVYAYDTGRNDLIAKGVRVGGIDVGGLRANQARERLAAQLLTPLRQPVVARHGDATFTLTSQEAGVGVDIDGSVDHALDRSRTGNLLSRTMRGLTGETVRVELPVDITYDQKAVDRMVRTVEKKLEAPAVSADVDFSDGHVTPRRSHAGLAVRANLLRRDLSTALTGLRAPRDIRIVTRMVKPKVTTEQLAEKYPAVLIVNRNAFRLTLYKKLRPAKTFRIAVGQAGLETPAGLYHIQDKQTDPVWHVPDSDWAGKLRGKVIPADDPRNPIEARWMGIYNGAGIHGTTAVNSLGTAASHGCIRMAIPDVIELFDEVPIQAPVYIL
jgi:lipoprotein-anchoring transpeptidase ErfK/SrfK